MYSLKDLPREQLKLTEVENEVILTRISSTESFCDMDTDKKDIVSDKVMMYCVSMYGWTLPANQIISSLVSEEIKIFLSRHFYSCLSEEEIFLALRINYSPDLSFPDILDIGRVYFINAQVNAGIVSKIIDNYMKLRVFIDRKLQNIIDGY